MGASDSNISIVVLGLKTLLFSKFGSLMDLSTASNDISFYPPEVAFRETAEKRGVPKMNFISFWNTSMGADWARRRTPTGRSGISVAYSDSTETGVTVVKAVPVKLSYEIDFWVVRGGLDALMKVGEEYLFWIDDDPNLDLEFNGIPLSFQLHFGDIRDISDMTQQYAKGQYFVFRAPVVIDGWLPKFSIDWLITSIYCDGYIGDTDESIKIFSKVIE